MSKTYVDGKLVLAWLMFLGCSLGAWFSLYIWLRYLTKLSKEVERVLSIVNIIPYPLIIANDELYDAIDSAY